MGSHLTTKTPFELVMLWFWFDKNERSWRLPLLVLSTHLVLQGAEFIDMWTMVVPVGAGPAVVLRVEAAGESTQAAKVLRVEIGLQQGLANLASNVILAISEFVLLSSVFAKRAGIATKEGSLCLVVSI